MTETKEIRDALMRMADIVNMRYCYDPTGDVNGEGPIHFLVEIGDLTLIAWEDHCTEAMIINPITRFEFSELHELGAEEPWTLIRLPSKLNENVQFQEIDNFDLGNAYQGMRERALVVRTHV
jgi:hypothetical protein